MSSSITSHPKFKEVLKAVQDHGTKLNAEVDIQFARVATDMLVDKVEAVARQLSIEPQSVLITYDAQLMSVAPQIAQSIEDARALRSEQIDNASPAQVTISQASRLIMSLSRVSWVVGFNEYVLTQKNSRLEAMNLMSSAADAIAIVSMAIESAHQTGQLDKVAINNDGVVRAIESLQGTIEKVRLGAWNCGSPELDRAVQIGMAEDLAPLLRAE